MAPLKLRRGGGLQAIRSGLWSGSRKKNTAVRSATAEDTQDAPKEGVLLKAWRKLKKNPKAYLPIPIIAGLVGYGTNWMAVQMIFYPITWTGFPVRVWESEPFGLFGWQGIVPAKAGKMSSRMVEMVTSKLLCVPEVFSRLQPQQVSEALLPLVQESVLPSWGWLRWLSAPFLTHTLKQCTLDLQQHIESILSLRELVVGEMLRDRTILVDLFQKVGHKELRFLTDSGLFFGFLLGLLQMLAWLVFPRAWTLPVGGAIVGYLTNWIALKMIFEPVDPVRVMGLFTFQGLFLRRQEEVSIAFSEHLSKAVLTSQKMWENMLCGSGADGFFELLRRNVPWVVPTTMVSTIFSQLKQILPSTPSHPLHAYADSTLALKETLISKMRLMTSTEFESVLHPIFQEDEMTLILAGAVLGAIAGGVQQYLGAKLSKESPVESTQSDKLLPSQAASSRPIDSTGIGAKEEESQDQMDQQQGDDTRIDQKTTLENDPPDDDNKPPSGVAVAR